MSNNLHFWRRMILTENLQLKILKEIKFFFSKYEKCNDLISSLDYFYLCPYGANKGTSRLIFFFDKFLAVKTYIIATIKDLYQSLRIGKFFISNFDKNYQYKTIIFNWGTINDFDDNGNYYDKHFNVKSSSCKKILWVIVYLDNKIPERLSKNITLICNEKKLFNFNNIIDILEEYPDLCTSKSGDGFLRTILYPTMRMN